MRNENAGRRSFLLTSLALAGGALLAGCEGGGSDKVETVKPAEDPSVKAKESMDFYKNNMKKGAAKK
jgi:hypothetical protein